MLQKREIIGFIFINAATLVFGMRLYSQDANNYLSVTSSIRNVNINSVSTIETQQIQSNAFSISIKSYYNNFNVYANISFYSSSNGYVLGSDLLAIKLNTVSPSRTANFNRIPITGGNQLIIQSTRTTTSTVVYNYDMYIGPVGYDTPPGTYNATILFTMTQP